MAVHAIGALDAAQRNALAIGTTTGVWPARRAE
jgi:hypothetical protein